MLLLLPLNGAVFASVRAEVENLEQTRSHYRAAIKALKAGNLKRYHTLYGQLDGYVLQGFVKYEYLRKRIPETPAKTIHEFLDKNRYAFFSPRLRKKWLYHLVRRKDWETFLQESEGVEDDSKLYCYRLSQLIKKSEDQAALMDEIKVLWLTGKRLPSACNAVFDAWRKAGHMTSEIVWTRIRMAMERGSSSLANQLGRYLDPKDRIWVKRWRAMHKNPLRELGNIKYPVETPVARMIVKHGIVRQAYRDPESAIETWVRLKRDHQFFGEDDNYVLRRAGLIAAHRHLPIAIEWLSAVSAEADDKTLRLWRLKAAIRGGRWEKAKRFIAALTEEERNENQWRYWEARILQETGEIDDAQGLFHLLAQERGYYGFLAADRVDVPYSLQHKSIEVTPAEVGSVLAKLGIAMAQEFYELGETINARRQWNWTSRSLNNRELQIAAVIASHWGWHDRAILTVGKSDHRDDLDLRFPILYRDLIEANAEATGLDPGWIYGVMRQESAFVEDARSSAGALGLMQLMPRTGRLTSRRLNLKIRSNRAILKVENNVRLGTSYLKNVLKRNKGHQVLATASYNAGPNRVKKWLPDEDSLDADVWVDSIPFYETREYVKNVMAFTTVYDYRLKNESIRLRERMPEIFPFE